MSNLDKRIEELERVAGATDEQISKVPLLVICPRDDAGAATERVVIDILGEGQQ
jgi:hypothetical protein